MPLVLMVLVPCKFLILNAMHSEPKASVSKRYKFAKTAGRKSYVVWSALPKPKGG
jgi:hypothetical protein